MKIIKESKIMKAVENSINLLLFFVIVIHYRVFGNDCKYSGYAQTLYNYNTSNHRLLSRNIDKKYQTALPLRVRLKVQD